MLHCYTMLVIALVACVPDLYCIMQPFDEAMKKAKCSLASDGWQDAHKRPLLNVCGITPLGSTFIKAVDTTGKFKVLHSPYSCILTCLSTSMCCTAIVAAKRLSLLQNSEYIASVWIKCIEEVGDDNVMQMLSDSAKNCKGAGQLVTEA